MVNFWDRLFGKEDVDVSAPTPTKNDPEFAAEVRNLKISKFYKALEDYIGRSLKSEERDLVTQALDPKAFENMVGEEIGATARMIAENFHWPSARDAEWVPGQDPFLPMGPIARQQNFERGLAEYLGRPPSSQELTRVRQAFLSDDQARREEFEDMVGEEAASYAKKLAYAIGLRSAEESAAPVEDSYMSAAAK